MGFKLSLTVAAVLAAALLIPVLVIIALGTYGESIGIRTTDSADGEPALTVQPDRGPSDSNVLIEGQGWPPQSEISLFLGQEPSADTGRILQVPLATVTASATGTFTMQLKLPPSLFTVDARRVQIRGTIQPDDGRPPVGASVDFDIQPYPNLVTVDVIDARTGVRLDSAEVLLRDSFGAALAGSRTDATGIAEFAGVAPGDAAAEVRRLDYQGARVELSIAATGPTRIWVNLTPDPGKRLLLPFDVIVDAGHLRIMTLDRASGLRADEIVNRESAGPAFPAEIHFFYLFPTGNTGTPPDIVPEEPSLQTMRAWALRCTENLRAIVARVTLLGLSSGGDVVLVTESTGTGFGRGSSTWLLLDPETGRERRRGELLQGSFVAGLSSDRGSLYVIDNSSNQLAVIPLTTEDEPTVVTGLPSNVLRLATDPSGALAYLLTAGAGGVYRVDLVTREITGPIVSITRATWLTTDRAGTRLYLVGPGLESLTVLSDLDGPLTIRTVPLPGSATWIWADFDGPYLYAGGGQSMIVSVLDAESLEIIDRHSTEDLDALTDRPLD